MSTETLNQQIPAGTWAADPVHSAVLFAISHNQIATFRSGFTSFEATLSGGEAPRLEGSVAVDSVDVAEEQLKGHLLSPDFFDVQKFPRLGFSSSSLRIDEDGTAHLAGELQIRGETRAVEATGRFGRVGSDLAGSERLGLSFEATVDRREFDLGWNTELPSGGEVLEYDVAITVELEFLPQES